MTIALPAKSDKALMYGCFLLSIVNLFVDRKWHGSVANSLVFYAWQALFFVWLGSKIRTGYRRRRPYWTAESWRRYLRLAIMPVAAVVLFLGVTYVSDHWPGLLGPAESAARILAIVGLLILMLLGAGGTVTAIDWMNDGDASVQFTRTRWFRRHGTSKMSD